MKKNNILLLAFFAIISINAQNVLSVDLDKITQVSGPGEGGLYFAGTKNQQFRFSQRITPHGDCLDVVNGYAFVTWYKGGVEFRNLMLSRKNLTDPDSQWVTIEFPHQHVGIRGEFVNGTTPARGDSHNTAAIGISTIDNTVHMIYDMHSYTKSLLPTSFFNYTVSVPGAAFLPDSEFTIDKFLPKQNMLNSTEDYERMTYPFIMRADDGSLIVRYRQGGSGEGNILFAHYDGTKWTDNWTYGIGILPEPNTHSIYGSERFLNGKFHSGFSIRYNVFRDYFANNGFYFAYTNDSTPSAQSQWFNVKDQAITLPFNNPDSELAPGVSIKVAEPSDDYGIEDLPSTTFDPAWIVTESGAIHFVTRVDGRNVHYYRAAGATNFSSNHGGIIPNPQVRGKMFSYKKQVFMVELLGGRVNVKTTPEGVNAWKIVYTGTETNLYQHFNAIVANDKLYVYLMSRGSNVAGEGDSRPLFFQEFSLGEEIDANPAPISSPDTLPLPGTNPEPEPVREVAIAIEAEDFDGGGQDVSYFDKTPENSGNAGYRTDEAVDIDSSDTASGGRVITIFEGAEYLVYTFNVDTAGEYDLIVTASVRTRDDSIMDVQVNETLFENVPIAKTGDWNVFKANIIPKVTLKEGENTLRVTQKRSQSSRLDKLEFATIGTGLSIDDIEAKKAAITIFPNPSKGVFYIQSKVFGLDYVLRNMQGQLMDSGRVLDDQVDFSKFTTGVYFLELSKNNEFNLTKKIIIR